MKTTKHAKKRISQRGFSNFTLDIIQKYGNSKKAPGGAINIFFGNKEYQRVIEELKRAIQLMDRAKNGNIIIKGDRILTVYK